MDEEDIWEILKVLDGVINSSFVGDLYGYRGWCFYFCYFWYCVIFCFIILIFKWVFGILVFIKVIWVFV